MNAKEEFLKFTENKKIKCGYIEIENDDYWNTNLNQDRHITKAFLKVGYTKTDLDTFLKDLDFAYSDGFGGQELFGRLWFRDGSWATRGEYDGSEWWSLHSLPEIPEKLLNEKTKI